MTYRPLLDKAGSKIKTQSKTNQWPSKPSDHSDPSAGGGYPRNHHAKQVVNRNAATRSEEDINNSDQGILLSKVYVRGDGFEQLPDGEDYAGHHKDDPDRHQPSATNAAIMRTTSIHMSWGDRA